MAEWVDPSNLYDSIPEVAKVVVAEERQLREEPCPEEQAEHYCYAERYVAGQRASHNDRGQVEDEGDQDERHGERGPMGVAAPKRQRGVNHCLGQTECSENTEGPSLITWGQLRAHR